MDGSIFIGMDGVGAGPVIPIRPLRFAAVGGEIVEQIGSLRRFHDLPGARSLLASFHREALRLGASTSGRDQRLAEDCRRTADELAQAVDRLSGWTRCQDGSPSVRAMFEAAAAVDGGAA